jgi:hypothetical protein
MIDKIRYAFQIRSYVFMITYTTTKTNKNRIRHDIDH